MTSRRQTLQSLATCPTSLDSSFGTGGKVTTTWGSSEEGADAIAIQPDGKLIVAGHWNWSYACSPRGRDVCERDESAFALGRYLRDGLGDMTFGTGGRVKTHLGGATAIAVEPDGKILVATDKSELVRYTPSGQLDRTFGAQGKVQLRMPGKPQKSLIALEGNGAIIAVGTWHITVRHGLDDVESGFTLTRLDAAGTPDRAFGIGGRVASRFPWAGPRPSPRSRLSATARSCSPEPRARRAESPSH